MIYLSLGSNMGDKVATLIAAIEKIKALPVTHVKVSKFYTTAPQGYVDQDDFVNVCVSLESAINPLDLLAAFQGIEADLHRERIIRWGPRTIDIDIIWIDGYSSHSAVLTVPHPRAFERAFVVKPLLDLPIEHPELLKRLKEVEPLLNNQEIQELEYDHKST